MSGGALKEDSGIYHLTVGTEVSAKYRGAFCEAQIKLVKKNVLYKVQSKKTGKSHHLPEENIEGVLKIGSAVEALFPEQSEWQECTIQNAKDRSSYTVIFDDGDERTLSRGSLCLKGDRHYAKSETLDNLPLTDPENFGTPVLAMKKSRSRRRPVEDEYDDESEDQKTPDREKPPKDSNKKKQQDESDKQESSSEEDEENDDEKRKRWLADVLMGKVVIVEPNDKRKHWFPGLVVNPLCYERHQNLAANHIVVRSFKTGKFLRVNRASIREMTSSTTPTKLDSVWKEIVSDAQNWQTSRLVSDRWRMDIKDILSDSEDDESTDEEEESGKNKKTTRKEEKKDDHNDDDQNDKEEEKKNHDFLEVLYKFMDDRGTPINKTPVLGYKDLDLYLLYGLVEQRQGSHSIKSIKEWKQIYLDLGIPKPNPAAGYNVRTAYEKYLGGYEEYCMSWKHLPLPTKKSSKLSGAQTSTPKEKKKTPVKVKEEPQEKTNVKKESDKNSQEKRKMKLKDKDSQKQRSLDSSSVEGKTRGRSSPTITDIKDIKALTQQRRSVQRRRASESSSASDVTSSGKIEKKKSSATKALKKDDDRFRSPGGPDSEPDDSSRSVKIEKKDSTDKKGFDKLSSDSQVLKRIRRNSTSNVSTQYVIGDRLKVKYGQGKTFKIYVAKVLQVIPPEGPGEVTEYLVHYQGWNARHDEIIKPHRIVSLADERSGVPQSPSSHSKSPRRPKTPSSTRTSSVSSKDDITPSPGLSVELSKRFSSDADLSHITDELPSFTLKPRIPHGLKKNLSEELAKSARESETPKSALDEEVARPTSPILVGSQRSKRSKSPQITTDTHTSPVLVRTKSIDKTTSASARLKKTDEKSSTTTEKETAKKSPEPKDDTVIKEDSEKTKSESPKQSSGDKSKQSEDKTDTDSNSSVSEESVSKVESSEDNSDEAPLPQPRRTSSRRSKSPAYLSDSWYHTKRRKFSTSANEKTPSPVPSPVTDPTSDKPTTQTPCEPGVIPAVTAVRKSQRSPSPSLSISSSNSTTSGESELSSKEKSPVLAPTPSSPAAFNTPVTSKSRDKAKSKSSRSQEKVNVKSDLAENNDKNNNIKDKLPDAVKGIKVESTQTSEYDNFDEEAPSIALEKHKKSRQSLGRTNEKRKQPLNPAQIISAKDEKEGIEIGETKSLMHEREIKVASARKAADERNNDSNRRKIRKRKGNNNTSDQTDKPKSPKVEKIENKDECATNDIPLPTTQQSNIPTVTSDNNATAGPSSSSPSNHENLLANNPVSHNLPLHPQNPPSSSKSLLENTPPTTPEQSPTRISEDQDIEIDNKHSPMLDSDAMDIGEEHKDNLENTSSSGNEQPMPTATDESSKKNENDDKEDENTETQSIKKKQRGTKKRTTEKNRNNRRMSCGNDKDSESEDEADNETGERKRHESGKQRKKKAKARPEPPTAPPPLPRETLEGMSQDERIALLQSRMAEMRKVYHQLKQEVANIDRKRKRAKRREREAAEAAQSNDKVQSAPYTPSKSANGAGNKIESATTRLMMDVAKPLTIPEVTPKSEDKKQSA